MRRFQLSAFFLAAMAFPLYLLMTSSSGGRAGAANSGNTGAPGESSGQTCGSCHSGGSYSPITEQLLINKLGSTDEEFSYEPGQTYELTYTISASGNPLGYGFQLTALDASNNQAGTFSAPADNVQIETASLVGGRTYVEHKGVLNSPIFRVQWTAPSVNSGMITFYHSANAVNKNNATSGDNGTLGAITQLNPPVGVGIESLFNTELLVHQAPGSGLLYLQAEWLSSERPAISVYEISGRRVVHLPAYDGSDPIDISGMAAGTGILQVQRSGGSLSRKFIRY